MTQHPHLQAVPDEFVFEEDDEEGASRRPRGRPRKGQSYKEFMSGVEHHFMFAASDSHGHSASVHVKHLPAIATRVDHLVENKALPFESKVDVWREAIYWYLEFIEQAWQDPEFSELMVLLRKQAQTNYQRTRNDIEVALIESTMEGVEEMLKARNWAELRNAIPHGRDVCSTSKVNTQQLTDLLDQAEREMGQR